MTVCASSGEPSWNLMPGAQLDRPDRVVRGADHRLGEVRVDLAVGARHRQRVVDRAGDLDAADRELRLVEAEATARVGLEAVGEEPPRTPAAGVAGVVMPTVVVGPLLVVLEPSCCCSHTRTRSPRARRRARPPSSARDLRLRTTVPPDSSRSRGPDVSDRCCEMLMLRNNWLRRTVTQVTHRECNGGTYGWLRALSITLGGCAHVARLTVARTERRRRPRRARAAAPSRRRARRASARRHTSTSVRIA